MNSFGIHNSVTSLGNPWMKPFQSEESELVADEINETFAHVGNNTGRRTVGMGVLPSSSVDMVIREDESICSTGGSSRIVTGPKIAGHGFLDPELALSRKRLEASELRLLIHPQDGIAPEGIRGYRHVLLVGLGFPHGDNARSCSTCLGRCSGQFPKPHDSCGPPWWMRTLSRRRPGRGVALRCAGQGASSDGPQTLLEDVAFGRIGSRSQTTGRHKADGRRGHDDVRH